jgi:hypothetical protein
MHRRPINACMVLELSWVTDHLYHAELCAEVIN